MSREADNQPNIEEVLASIRRILASDSAGGARAADVPPPAIPVSTVPAIDEAAFDLPAMFRSNGGERTLAGLGPARSHAPAGELPPTGPEPLEIAPAALADDANLPRAMPFIKDRLIARMGQVEPAPSAAPELARAPERPFQMGGRVPRANIGAINFLLGEGAAQSKEDMAGELAEEPLAPLPSLGPAFSLGASAQIAPVRIDDAMAGLLRPLLRQWLDDNMKRVVARALHMEADDKK